ncbi:hypothetical protein ROZALSC1DRAFT_25872, partial [Rozella allomycis CSF55]
TLLEGLVKKNQELKDELIVKHLFELVSKIENEYMLKLTLTIMQKSIYDKINRNIFQVNKLVQILRRTENSQIHQQIFILLSEISEYYPELVLNHVISIFTFMSQNVLKYDDDYSFQVIEKTIKSIIKEYNYNILVKFIENLLFIPKHRRVFIIDCLISSMGRVEALKDLFFLIQINNFENVEFFVELCQLQNVNDLVNSLTKVIMKVEEGVKERVKERDESVKEVDRVQIDNALELIGLVLNDENLLNQFTLIDLSLMQSLVLNTIKYPKLLKSVLNLVSPIQLFSISIQLINMKQSCILDLLFNQVKKMSKFIKSHVGESFELYKCLLESVTELE